MAEIFVSHIHEELEVAEAVQYCLHEKFDRKHQIFLSSDKWQIFGGEIWLDRIRQELTSAKVVVIMLSKKSIERPWVNFEAGAAWLTNKTIIPVCFGNLSKELLPKPYSNIQAIELPDENYYLVTSVAHHLDVLPPPPPFIQARDSAYKRIIDSIVRFRGEDSL